MQIHLLRTNQDRLFICVNGTFMGSRRSSDHISSFKTSVATLLVNALVAAGIPEDSIEVLYCPLAMLDDPEDEIVEAEVLQRMLDEDPSLANFTFQSLSRTQTAAAHHGQSHYCNSI